MKGRRAIIIRFGERFAGQRATAGVKKWEARFVAERVSLRLDEILSDLGLGAYKLAVRMVEPGEKPSRFAFDLELDGVVCHGPLDRGLGARIGAEHIADLISILIILHRDSILPQVAQDGEWERILECGLPRDWVSRPEFNDFVTVAIRNGLDVPKAVDALASLFQGGMRPDELPDHVEAILATRAEPFIRVRVGSMDGMEEADLCKDVMDGLFYATGLPFPPLKVLRDEGLAAPELRIELNKLRIAVKRQNGENAADFLVDMLRDVAPIFTTTTTIDYVLGRFTEAFPMIVFNAIEAFGTASVLRVLRSLVDEGVDIRDLRTILCAMLEANATLPADREQLSVIAPYEAAFLPVPRSEGAGAETDRHVECVRVQLKDQISQACADSKRILRVIRISPLLEARLSRADRDRLSVDEIADLLSEVARATEKPLAGTVLLASNRNRRRLWKLIRGMFPRLPVLCEAEISPYVRRKDAGEIGGLPEPAGALSAPRGDEALSAASRSKADTRAP